MIKNSISIVIVNWNSGVQLLECITSINQYGNAAVQNIIVVDNGSSDGSEKICEGLPKVQLLRTGANLGFGKACNIGAEKCGTEYILFLNPDARLMSGALDKILVLMRAPSNAEVGICGVQLIDKDGHLARSCARFPSAMGFAAHITGFNRLIPTFDIRMSDWDHSTTRIVDQVIGAFFFVRSAVFEALDGFDERFFVYFEEVDFSYRAKNIGWSSIYFSEAQAFHSGGGTSDQVKAKRLFYSMRSRMLYAKKHFNLVSASITWILTLFFEPISRIVFSIAKKSMSDVLETLKGYAYIFIWLPQYMLMGKTR